MANQSPQYWCTCKNANEKPITLKRNVTVQAIVTEDFKKLLSEEISLNRENAEKRMHEIDKQANDILANLDRQKHAVEVAQVERQLQQERANYEATIRDLNGKLTQSKVLQVNSLFTQGTIEGFVNVKKGDNLYEKMGGLLLVVKDGIVQDIRQLNFEGFKAQIPSSL